MTEGLPRLLDLLSVQGVPGTFFTTGEMARRFPDVIKRLVDEGHELACHGDLHRDFTRLSRDEAKRELECSVETLSRFATVVSFRAPYLRFPAAYLPLLMEHGLWIDSSVARYKFGPDHRAATTVPGLIRIAASVTSSVLRVPALIRRPWLAAAKKPLVLFVHPWEAVDFRQSTLRWDCRFRTGDAALVRWGRVLKSVQRGGARLSLIREIGEQLKAAELAGKGAQAVAPLSLP